MRILLGSTSLMSLSNGIFTVDWFVENPLADMLRTEMPRSIAVASISWRSSSRSIIGAAGAAGVDGDCGRRNQFSMTVASKMGIVLIGWGAGRSTETYAGRGRTSLRLDFTITRLFFRIGTTGKTPPGAVAR